jgi:RNA polymerase sigma factor (TIGR02999 family)
MSDEAERGRITELLVEIRRGHPGAMERLLAMVYDDLRRRARRQLRRAPQATLGTTGLVHEAYLRLVASPNLQWQDRNHFFAVASRAMRSVVVDYARRRSARKRGGALPRVELDEGMLRVDTKATEILAIDQALGRLAALDHRLCELVELRFFGGLSVDETAEVLGVSDRTVKRDWSKARTLLHRFLAEAS